MEKKLYDEFPNYKNSQNFFMCNGFVIEKSKALKENKVKDKSSILMTIRKEEK